MGDLLILSSLADIDRQRSDTRHPFSCPHIDNKLIRRRDSERELSLRQHRTRTTKYNRLVHKFRHRSTQLCVGTPVYQIQGYNAM